MFKNPVPAPKRWSLHALQAHEQQRVANLASALQQSADAGRPLRGLRGKNLAVLCEDGACPHLAAFQRAAVELGAQVTHIRPSEALDFSAGEPGPVSQLLGRLYDAIDCHGLEPSLVWQLERLTGKPVFDDIAAGPVRDGPDLDPEHQNFLLQALLMSALA